MLEREFLNSDANYYRSSKMRAWAMAASRIIWDWLLFNGNVMRSLAVEMFNMQYKYVLRYLIPLAIVSFQIYPIGARKNLATTVWKTMSAASLAPIVNWRRRNAPARKNLRPQTISTNADTVSCDMLSGILHVAFCMRFLYDYVYIKYMKISRKNLNS